MLTLAQVSRRHCTNTAKQAADRYGRHDSPQGRRAAAEYNINHVERSATQAGFRGDLIPLVVVVVFVFVVSGPRELSEAEEKVANLCVG